MTVCPQLPKLKEELAIFAIHIFFSLVTIATEVIGLCLICLIFTNFGRAISHLDPKGVSYYFLLALCLTTAASSLVGAVKQIANIWKNDDNSSQPC